MLLFGLFLVNIGRYFAFKFWQHWSQYGFESWNLKNNFWKKFKNTIKRSLLPIDLSVSLCDFCGWAWLWICVRGWNCDQQMFDLAICNWYFWSCCQTFWSNDRSKSGHRSNFRFTIFIHRLILRPCQFLVSFCVLAGAHSWKS